jgi:hypothetical protein
VATGRRRVLRGAAVGAGAGIAWKAVEPLLQRAFRSPYSDAGIACRFVSDRPVAAYVTQAIGGATFGATFARLGGRGVERAVASALVENTVLWPAVWAIQRYHPDVRAGRWPKPFRDPGAIAVSFTGHALFGVLLGVGLDPPKPRR